jgi:cytochrome b561
LTPALALAGIAGTGWQEAFQLLQNASAIFYGLTYLVMFAIPILGQAAPSLSLRLAAASGFAMTLLCVVLSIFPIINVPSRRTFTLKVSCAVIVSNGLAALIYRFQTRLSRRIIARQVSHLNE